MTLRTNLLEHPFATFDSGQGYSARVYRAADGRVGLAMRTPAGGPWFWYYPDLVSAWGAYRRHRDAHKHSRPRSSPPVCPQCKRPLGGTHA